MYGTTSNKGTFFQTEKAKEISTDKCVFGNFSQRVKDSKAENGYTYENWSVRLVGVACGKAIAGNLSDKTFIELTQWSVHNPYNKEKERNEPYILVTDYNIVENTDNVGNTDNAGDGFMEYPEEETPLN